jgi:hypothetical protein
MKLPLIASLLLLLADNGASQGSSFQVSGYVSAISPRNGEFLTNSRGFWAVVSESNALIHAQPGSQNVGLDYSEFGTEDTNGFHISKFARGRDPVAEQGVRNDSTMTIQPTRVPGWDVGGLVPLWLAFGSHLEFQVRRDEFLPMMSLPILVGEPSESLSQRTQRIETLLRMKLRSQWQLNKRKPFLTETFVDYRDAKWDSEDLSPSTIPREYSTGRSNWTYRVQSWTNVNGLHIPLHAQLIRFRENTNPSSPQLLTIAQDIRIVVTNVATGVTRKSFVPLLSTSTRVLDRRFNDGNVTPEYYPTNGVLAGAEEEAWNAHWQHKEESRQRVLARRKARGDTE